LFINPKGLTMIRSINFMRLDAGEMIAIGSAQGEVVLDPLALRPSLYRNVRVMTVMDHPAGMSLGEQVYLCCVPRAEASRTPQYALGHSQYFVGVGDEVFLVNTTGGGHTHFTATSVRIVPD
jgi:hypothetical protein